MTGAQRRNRLSHDELRACVAALWLSGLNSTQISIRLDYSVDYIKQIAKELGLAFKTPPALRTVTTS